MWERRGSTRCSQWVSDKTFLHREKHFGLRGDLSGGHYRVQSAQLSQPRKCLSQFWTLDIITPVFAWSARDGRGIYKILQIWLGCWKQDWLLLCLTIEKKDWKISSSSGVSKWTRQNIEDNGNEGIGSALIKDKDAFRSLILPTLESKNRAKQRRLERIRTFGSSYQNCRSPACLQASCGERTRAHFRPTTCLHRQKGATTVHKWDSNLLTACKS